MKKLLIINDNHPDLINGVVTTFENTIKVLEAQDIEVVVINPNDFKSIALPTYKEIKIAINPWKVFSLIDKHNPDYIHIATEGPLGLFAGMYCRKKKYNFTTSYHTKMPEYIKERFPWMPLAISYAFMKFIHKKSSTILVTTESMKNELIDHGFKSPIKVWGRGVDTSIFNDDTANPSNALFNYPDMFKPYALYVGRVSPEKNLDAFLDMDIPVNKIIVGNGPAFNELHEKICQHHTPSKSGFSTMMVGAKKGKELQEWYANADVFVFPSKTDTFGIVMLEAMACGTPVIGYPVTGPIDCVQEGITGSLDESLDSAFSRAISLDRNKIFTIGQANTWEKCSKVFLNTLVKR